MDWWLPTLGKLAPIYSLIGLGWVLHRWVGFRPEPVGRLLFYGVGPVFIALSLWQRSVPGAALRFSLITFLLCCSIGTVTFLALRRSEPRRRAITAFSIGSANSGYFGIPVLLALFGPEILPTAVLGSLGFTFYESSLGFYFAARGQYSLGGSVKKILRLPLLYATAFGILAGVFQLPFPKMLAPVCEGFRWTYLILGMSLVGIAAGSLRFRFERLDLVANLTALKFILWPFAVATLLYIDGLGLGLLSADQVRVLCILSVAPLPAISVAVASILNLHAEETAAAVLLSTLISLVTMPAAAFLTGN